jgi:phage gp29-like protein
MPILDARGNPVNTGALDKEIATATLGGLRNVWHDSVARGITPARLAAILTAADEGDLTDYLTLAEEMEERDPNYRSKLSVRKMAAQALPLVVSAADPDDAQSVKIQEDVQQMLDAPIVINMIGDALDAIGKGFSVIEIMWDRGATKWTPAAYEWRDPHFFTVDDNTGREIRLLTNEAPSNGEALEPYKFINHQPMMKSGLPIRGGLARVVAALHLYKSYALKDWMVFAEIYGIPLRLGRYAPEHNENEIATLRNAVANIGTDAAAVIPKSMELEFISTKAGDGRGLFEILNDWCDKQITLAVLGTNATSESGGSFAKAAALEIVRDDIKRSDARQMAQTLNRDLVRPYVDLNYGSQKEYPTASLEIEDEEDLESLAKALAPFIDRGLRIEAAAVRDKFGFQDPAEDAEILTPKAGGGPPVAPQEEAQASHCPQCGPSTLAQRSPDIIDQIGADFDNEWREVLNPWIEPIARLAETSNGYSEFRRRLPSVLKDVLPEAFVEKLATMDFMARGHGDATDANR